MTRILIVDDNEINLKIHRDILTMHQYEVLEAREAQEAIEITRSHLPDLILMDLQLPSMSGMEITKILKSDERTRTIPIVALTAMAMARQKEEFLLAGGNGYLTKPFIVDDLLNEIRKAFEYESAEPPSTEQ
jgi:two-component system, cell cycle response regulator DivK